MAKRPLQAHPATSCCRSAICSILAAGWPFQGSAVRFHMSEAIMDGQRPLQAHPATRCCRSAICSILAAGSAWLAIPGLCNEVSDSRSQNGWQKTLAGISITSCNKLLQICNLQHSGCWLAIPGLCSEVSHVRSQNGWKKDP